MVVVGARAAFPAFVVGLGSLVTCVFGVTALYTFGVVTLGGFVSVFSKKGGENYSCYPSRCERWIYNSRGNW